MKHDYALHTFYEKYFHRIIREILQNRPSLNVILKNVFQNASEVFFKDTQLYLLLTNKADCCDLNDSDRSFCPWSYTFFKLPQGLSFTHCMDIENILLQEYTLSVESSVPL